MNQPNNTLASHGSATDITSSSDESTNPKRLGDRLVELNKPILLQAMLAHGIQVGELQYSGRGDEGGLVGDLQIRNQDGEDDIVAKREALFKQAVQVWSDEGNSWWRSAQSDAEFEAFMSVEDSNFELAINSLAESLLDFYFSGFEDGEGGQGRIVFDASRMEIRFEHQTNVTTTEDEEVVL